EDGDGHRVDGVGVAARPEPGNDPGTRPLGMFSEGDRVGLIERRDEWVRVQAPEAISGWVEAVDIVEIDDGGEQVARAWREAAQSPALEAGIASRPTVVLPSVGRIDEEGEEGKTAPPEPIAAADEPVGQAATLAGGEIDNDPGTGADIAPSDGATQVESGAEEPADLASAPDVSSANPLVDDEPAGTVDAPAEVVAVDEVAEGDYLRVGEGGTPVHALDSVDSARIEVLAEGTL